MISFQVVKQGARRENADTNNRLMFFASKISIYFSYLFINFGISPDGVTFIFFLTGLTGSLVQLEFSFLNGSIAYLLWRLHIVFDVCDGEVARFTKKYSIRGAYWDYMIHALLYPLYIGNAAVASFRYFNDPIFLYMGIFGAISVSLTLSVKNNYFRAMLFNNMNLDVWKERNIKQKKSGLKFWIFFVLALICGFEGFLFSFLIAEVLKNKTVTILIFVIYILLFTIIAAVKFILFTKKGSALSRS